MATEKQCRAWTAVVYPESLPANWRDLLDETHLQWVESPLHNKDKNADGEDKKAHYHLVVVWDGPSRYSTAEKLFHETLNGTIPQPCASLRGLVRYMAHLDNPEKYQYPITDIKAHGGADLDELLKPTAAYKQSALKEMMMYIMENQITEFCDFAFYCATEREDWFDILANSNTLFLKEYIRSLKFKSLERER